MKRVNGFQAEPANLASIHQSHVQELPHKKMALQRAKCNKVNDVQDTQRPLVEAIRASFRENHQNVLVTVYQFLNFHGLKMCQSLLV